MGNNKYKILIVEDEANIRSFIKANLETSDYQVLCAETCALGIMMYASHRPDLIVLDLGLPDRDGLDLIQKVRESDTVPIIVLSARSNERDTSSMSLASDTGCWRRMKLLLIPFFDEHKLILHNFNFSSDK